MSKFVQVHTLDPMEFDGDKVEAKIKPMPRSLYVALLPILQEMDAAKNELKESLGISDDKDQRLKNALGRDARVQAAMVKAMDAAAPAVQENVVELTGLTDAAKQPVPLATVLSAAYFWPVALHLVMGWVNTTNVKEDEEKNSERPSGG